ncbi:MAG: hypothetical protein WA821_14125 [Anaerolineales bacterium]
MSAFDLNFISLYRINGNEWPVMPGLLALNPPRKTARGREQDRLLVYLTLAGSVAYSPAEYGELTAKIAESFYGAAGSMTLALKTAVEWLNASLVEHNGQGQYSVGALVLAALRGNSLYITQCGPTHVYWLMSGEARHFNDATLAGRGLGLSEKAQMYFSQVNLNVHDRMLFCAALPPNWDKSLSEERGNASLETTRRRLLAITDTNVSAVLFQAVEGSGAMNVLRAAPSRAPAKSEQPAVNSLPAQESNQASVDSAPKPPDESPAVTAPAQVTPLTGTQPPARARTAARKKYWPKLELPISPERRAKLKKGVQATASFLARSIQSARRFGRKVSGAAEKMVPRLLPDEQEQNPAGSPGSWLAFIAVAIPLLVVTVSVLVYYQLGQPDIFYSYYNKALTAAQQAQSEQNPTNLRTDWETVLSMLHGAERYPIPEKMGEVLQLRNQAQQGLDKLDGILRVKYRPAFSSPLRRMSVTHMAASDIDVYLLDDLTGSVIRGSLNGQSYVADPGFASCKPGTYNGVGVSRLIDIVALPRTNPSGASLIGIDASGNLLYCASGEAPKAVSLQAPDVGWNGITAIAYDANNLYVLDAPGRAVWVFFGTTDIQFPQKPYFFFESQVPNGMEQAVGMTVNGDDLYLLHKDGHLTTCTLSRIQASPTGCTDPAIFVDTRPDHVSGVTLTDGVFSQIAFTSPPDPAVALLEPYTQAIFRFSARALELQNQIQPDTGKDNPLPANETLTAMSFSPNKVLFAFVGGQLYFANLP